MNNICIFFHNLTGTALESATYRHPLSGEELPFLMGSHVTSEKGTGLVHTAPAHGHEDFQIAKTRKLKVVMMLLNNSYLLLKQLEFFCKLFDLQ